MAPVAAETMTVDPVPVIETKKVEGAKASRSRSRTRSRSRSTSRTRHSKLNMSHNLSLSDLMSRSFGPDKAEEEDQVEVQYYFWGAELSCSNPEYTWKIFNSEEECEDDLRHLLFLKQATLGINAVTKERNIIEVTAMNHMGERVSHILGSLTLDLNDTIDLDMALQYDQEITFKLLKGSGPVHLVGNHYVETPGKEAEEEIETDDDDEVEDLDDLKSEDEKDLKEGENEDYESEDEKSDKPKSDSEPMEN